MPVRIHAADRTIRTPNSGKKTATKGSTIPSWKLSRSGGKSETRTLNKAEAATVVSVSIDCLDSGRRIRRSGDEQLPDIDL